MMKNTQSSILHLCANTWEVKQEGRSDVAIASGAPFAGWAQPWAGLRSSLDPCPLEAGRIGKKTQTLEVRQTWVQVLPLPVLSSDLIFSIYKTGMIKLPC